MDALRGRGVEGRQHLEDVAFEGEVAHHVGPGEPDLAGRPEQPPHRVRGAHLQGVAAGRPERGPVPELEPQRRRATEEVGQQGRHRRRHTAPGVGARQRGLLPPGPQRARPGNEVRSHRGLLM